MIDGENRCELCDGTGWVSVKKERGEFARRCGCKTSDIYFSRAERVRIPKRFWGFDLRSYFPHRDHAAAQTKVIDIAHKFIQDYPGVEKGLLFQGISGVGKTRLLCSMANELLKKFETLDMLYIDWNDLVREMRAGEHHITRNFAEINRFIERLSKVDVLIFDEVGSSSISDLGMWIIDSIYYIFNKRYNNQKIILCATNFFDNVRDGKDSLSKRIGERIRSRLYEMADTIVIEGKDRRKEL